MEDNIYFYFLLGILAGAVPVTIIFLTLKYVRKKSETKKERAERKQKDTLDIKGKLKSVEEERIEKKGIRKTKN
jgi:hypothetical protein